MHFCIWYSFELLDVPSLRGHLFENQQYIHSNRSLGSVTLDYTKTDNPQVSNVQVAKDGYDNLEALG
jgi:hypothetical protein